MESFATIDEILDFAIEKEEEARDFYLDMAKKAASGRMAGLFKDFAAQEAGHRERLLKVKRGEQKLSPGSQVSDLKVSDYLVDPPEQGDVDYQDALILAMKREKAAFRLYTDLALLTADGESKALFLGLAQEEAKHKLYLELEYDEHVLIED